MSFLAPAFLWLGLLLIVPLILYLLPLPRQRMATSALYLWQRFLNTEPFGRASERTRRAVGFALLAAILISLVLAAAQMMVGRAAVKAPKAMVIIDASASMNATPADLSKPGRTNLDRARRAAQELIESVDAGSKVAVIESADGMRTLSLGAPGQEMARSVWNAGPFDGASQLRRTLAQAYELWGNDAGAEVFVFTDRALPANEWGKRAHAWIAPAAEDNVAVVALEAQRRGRQIAVRFTLANYAAGQRKLSGVVLANGQVRGSFNDVVLESGQTTPQNIRFDEAGAAAIEVKIEDAKDVLAVDDVGRATVPALEEMTAAVIWPDSEEAGKEEAKKKNEYVGAVLNALQEEGVLGCLREGTRSGAPVSVYVNRMPQAWASDGVIVLYPLNSGAAQVTGLHSEELTVTQAAADPLLADVDLRGLSVKGAVEAPVPPWAHPLLWAQQTPLMWAGQTGNTKVLFVGIPVWPTGSRLPLVASFPVLMRNALEWMLPGTEVLRPGEPVGDWTSRRAGFVKSAGDGKVHGFSVLSAETSDLRPSGAMGGETFATRHSLAMVLVMLALMLLAVEWGLFHRRLTE